MRTNRHYWTAVIAAWLVFIGIDFLFHASLLKDIWDQDITAIKPESELFQLIPFGYASFLLLIMLMAFLYNAIFKDPPSLGAAMSYGLVFTALFVISNLLGLYSYVDIPLNALLLFQLVYFIELNATTYMIYKTSTHPKPARMVVFGIIVFFVCLVAGVLIQNFI